MRISETPFAFLLDDCFREFGEEDGRKVYQVADDIFSKLEAESDYKGNEAIREHIQMKLLPPLAYYKALLSAGYSKTEALDYVRTEEKKSAEKKKESMSKMSRLPFAYSIYRMGVRKNDEIAFSGLLPKIRFERSGTLGNGAECCDFHFRKG